MIPGFDIKVLALLRKIYDLIISYPPGSAIWGSITGTLSNQTDLQDALDDKFNNPTGTTSEYIRGDGTLATLPTSSGIPHGTATGTDTYTTTIAGVTAYNDADAYLIRFTTGNTGSATLNINGIAAVPLYRNNDGALIGGDIIDGAEMLCVYNSSTNRFQVIGTAPNTLLAYVTNADSVAITKGQPVYAFGGQGDRLTVKRAFNTGDSTSAQTVGLVVSTSIGVNQKGLIMVNGLLDGLNLFPTATWADGDAVYLGATAGTLTKIKPHAPNHLVYLGFVTTASNGSAGRMYVRVQNGYEMDEIHDVYAQNPNNNDGLFFNTSNSLWESKSIATALGYTPGQGTVTSVAALTLGTTGTDLSSSVADSTTTPVITLNVPTASATNRGALSSADWSTFNGKQNAITGAATTITSSNLTASRALVSDGSGKVATNAVTSTELGYLSGVTSAIQTQLNTKIGVSKSVLFGNFGSGTVGAATTLYAGFVKGTALYSASQAFQARTVVPIACVGKNLTVNIGAQPASGSAVLTIRVDGVDSAYTLTIAAGSATGSYQNTSSSLSLSAGGTIDIKVQNNAAASTGAVVALSMILEI